MKKIYAAAAALFLSAFSSPALATVSVDFEVKVHHDINQNGWRGVFCPSWVMLTQYTDIYDACIQTDYNISFGVDDPQNNQFLTPKAAVDYFVANPDHYATDVVGQLNAMVGTTTYHVGRIYPGHYSSETVDPPGAANSAGVEGQVAYDDNYVYVCTATNTWKRAAISTW